ncbi:hypothetical protein KA005_36970 [bacterium]|nr:hypothetical protein [bacterium]
MPSELGNMNLEMDKVDLMKQVTVSVTLKMTHEQEWKIRMWLAKQLIIFAAWIANMGIEFDER